MPGDLEEQKGVGANQQDYDGRADKLWSMYNKEAESYDRALMETWKDDMNSLIIFAGLFSGVLTAFLIDTSKRLKVDPTIQTNALLSQSVVLLAQISQQLGSNGSQTAISLPQPLEPFRVTGSNLRVNIFWFMSLGFSITAALGATLVQQWVRDYLQVFQRLSGSLERSRMRQFLFHGLASNNIHVLVECIPTFIHISLFLFFIGLADNLFATNKTVAITTTIIIGFCVIFYMACSMFPIFDTKTPYHTPLSKVCWRTAQIVRPRKYNNKDTGGDDVSVSSNMVKGRLQLAMGHSDDRKIRDMEAIRWMVTKITEDREFEPFVASIGGSLGSEWGRDVWENIFNEDKETTKRIPDDTNAWPYPSMLLVRTPNTIQQLKIRIEGLLRTCAESTFLDQPTRFARACVCIDAVASLRLNLEDGLELKIDDNLMNQVLMYFSRERKRRERQGLKFGMPPILHNNTPQLDSQMTSTLLEIKWKCMMVIAMKKILRDPDIVNAVREVLDQLLINRDQQLKGEGCQDFMTEDDIKLLLKDGQSLNSPEQQESVARNVDVEVLNAWEAAKELRSLADIRRLESVDQQRESRLDDFLYAWRESVTTMQESLNSLNTQLADGVEAKITNLVNLLMRKTGGVLEHLGVSFEWPSDTRRSLLTRKDIMYYEIQGDILGPPTPEKTWEARAAFDMDNKWIMPRLLPPRLLVSDLLIYAHPTGHPLARYYMNSSKFKLPKLPRLDSNSPDLAAKILDIPEIDQLITQPMGARHYPQPFEDQLWRLRDLNDGGTGFLIELFFATFGSLEQTALTDESKQLIKATLHAITHDEETSKGLQKPACQKCLTALREELEEKLFKWHLPESAPQSTPNFVIDILLKLIDDTTDKVEEYVEPTSAEDSLGKEDKDKGWGDSQLKQRSEPRWLAWKESERPSENGKDLGRAKAKSKILSKPRSLSTGSGVVYVHGGPRAGQRRYKIRPATVQIRPAAVHIRPLAVQDTATVHTQRIDSVDEFT